MPGLVVAALALNLAGLTAMLVGWIGYRQPGHSVFALPPAWRAARYLQPTGVRLWVGGGAFAAVGATGLWIAVLRAPAG